MKIDHQTRGSYLLLSISGRLDATWADYFTETMLDHVRKGHHRLLIDTSALTYISSAGIRSLVTLYKELSGVKGSFSIIEPTAFVKSTLESAGFAGWLSASVPDDLPGEGFARDREASPWSVFVLDAGASMDLSVCAAWKPWKDFSGISRQTLMITHDTFALGVGSTFLHEEAGQDYGEFLALAGNVIAQPPEESARPDFLLAEKDYIPQIHVIQALVCQGEMSHLIRFGPVENKEYFALSDLAALAVERTGSSTAAFCMIGEIEGLVGAWLIRSPSLISNGQQIDYPEVRNWLSFSGERMFAGNQAMLFGLVCQSEGSPGCGLLSKISVSSGLHVHIHAAVFPYQPLSNGHIGLRESIRKFLNAAPPLALMHLVSDNRQAVGLGESSFTRGALWCAPLNNPEVLL